MMATDTGIASGAIANCTDGADGVPIKAWEVTLPASLSGVSSVVCTQAGKNLVDGEDAIKTANNIRFYYSTGKYYLAGTYTLSISENISGLYVRNVSTSTNIATKYNSNFITFTLTEKTLIGFDFYKVGINHDDNVMLEVGSTAHAYEPYQTPTVYTADLGRTIYGGQVDIVNGTGTDNCTRIKISELNWAYYTGGTNPIFYANNFPSMKTYARAEMPNIAIDGYTTITAHSRSNLSTNMANMECSAVENAQTIAFRNTTYTSKDDMLAAIGDNYIIYETTQTTDFTFTPISKPETYLGVNNFWIDCGDSSVEYYKSGYGYTSVTLNRPTSKNLFNVNKILGNGYFDVDGVWHPTTSYNAYSFRCNPNMTFTRQGNFAGIVSYWGISGNFLSAINQGSGSVKTFTTPENCYEFRLSIPIANLDGTQMVEIGESVSTYEAYSAVTKTAKLHRLIYEGSVDVIRGIGTISVGESGTEYDPPESFTFPPVSFDTIEGEQFLFASEGASALTYRKAVD